jgi:phospho-N-acetylmuramoyl-pentapeptide-transferase
MYYLFLGAAILSAALTGPLLFLLRRIKARQSVRKEGPASHRAKDGTPTMGGLAFFIIIIALFSVFVDLFYTPVIVLAAAFALIGFSDDLIKVLNKKNLGLTFRQKIFLQTMVALLFSGYLIRDGYVSGSSVTLLYYFFFWTFIVVGSANAANLTDGLDGLLAGCSTILFFLFGFVLFHQGHFGGMALSFIISGSVFGFLLYNFPRARLFMGDVGSLSIGALLAGIAIISHNEWLLVLIAGIFVAEALSVIIQVASFKFFKRRVFRMSPLHHHFELLGYKENIVVLGFWLVQLVLSVLGVVIT